MKILSTNDIENLYMKILVYGNSGAGKTTLCSTCPEKTLILSAESGLLSIAASKVDYVNATSLNDIFEVYKFLYSSDHDYKWLCIDSLSEICEVLLNDLKKAEKDQRRAYMQLNERAIGLVRKFRDLSLNVVMTSKIGKLQDDNSIIYGPDMPGQKLAIQLPYFFDQVWCLRSIKDEEGNVNRLLQTFNDDKYICKDRSGKLDSFEEPSIKKIVNKIFNNK